MAQDKNKSKEYIQYWAEGCSLSPCVASNIATVSDILHHDYPRLKCDYLNDVYAWDADSYEKNNHKYRNSETVDMVIGLNFGEMLMVEAKIDVQNVDNIKGEIEEKICHTKSYLVSSVNYKKNVIPSIVLFGQKNFERLSSRFRRLRSNKTDIKPMTLPLFYKNYFL